MNTLTLRRPEPKVTSRVSKLLQKEETARLNGNIPLTLHTRFTMECAKQRRSQTAVMIELIEGWLEQQ